MAQELKQGGYRSFGQGLSHYLNPEEATPNSIRMFLANLSDNMKEILGFDEETVKKNLEDRDAAMRLTKHELGGERFTGDLDSLKSRANEFAINLVSNIEATAPIKKAVSAVISPEDRARNLAKFMKGSEVTRPVYHGSNNEFSVFDKNKLGNETFGNASDIAYASTSKLGHWFNSGEINNAKNSPYSNIKKVYLNIKNPKEYNSLSDLAEELRPYVEKWEDVDWQNANPDVSFDDLINKWKKENLDDDIDGIVLNDEEFGGTSYVAFEPTQIKSATGNRGTFDPNDPNILHGLGAVGGVKEDKKERGNGVKKFKFAKSPTAKPFIIEADNEEDAKATLFRHLSEKGRESDYSQYKSSSEMAGMLRGEAQQIQERGTEPYLKESMTTGEKVGREIGGIFAPASIATADKESSLPVRIGAGILDVASNTPMGRVAGVAEKFGGRVAGELAGKIFGKAAPMASDVAIGTAQGVASGQSIGEAAATSGGVAGTIATGKGAYKLTRDLGPKGFANFSSSLSGASPEALEAYASGGLSRKSIQEAAGDTPDITKRLLDDLNDPKLTSSDKPEVVDALRGVIVDISPVIKKLESMKEVERDIGLGLSSSQKKINDLIDQRIKDLSPTGETFISGNSARIQRAEELDKNINFGPEFDKTVAGKFNEAQKEARKVYAQILIDSARPEYKGAMESWSKKIQAREKLLSDLNLSDDPEIRRRQAEKVLSNLFGKNKEIRREALQEFDDIFGKEYTENLKNAYYADQLGISKGAFKNQPSMLPMQTTGRSTMGLEMMKLGGGAGLAGATAFMGAPGVSAAMIPLVAAGWSPFLATKTLSGFGAFQKQLKRGDGFAEFLPAQNIGRAYSREKDENK
jgi:hypothetical protein